MPPGPTSETVAEPYSDYVMPIVPDYDSFSMQRATGTTLVTPAGDAIRHEG